MKTFIFAIFLLIPTIVQASLYDGLKPEEVSLLKKRLKLFKLDRAPKSPENPTDGSFIKSELQKNLEGSYLKKAQSQLGVCHGDDCLQIQNRGRVLFDRDGDNHCYPYTSCDYYSCMEKKYRCMDVGVEYFQNLAKPTCEAYERNISEGFFSKDGVEWIYSVMVCLQKGLFEECSLKGNCPLSESNEKTCHHITEFTLNFHPGCYIDSGVGVCKLPLKDQVNIWRTVGPFLTKRERREALKVVRYCLFGTPIK